MRPKCSRSGKHLRPLRQVRAAGVDQIDARQPVLARDLLRAQVLLHGHGIVGAALDGGVVAHDHAFAALDAADAGDDAGAVDRVLVHAVGGERRELEKRRAGVDQAQHAFSWKKLSARRMPVARARRPAERGLPAALLQLLNERAHRARRWRGTPVPWCRSPRRVSSPSPLCQFACRMMERRTAAVNAHSWNSTYWHDLKGARNTTRRARVGPQGAGEKSIPRRGT